MTLVAGSYEKYIWGFRIKGPPDQGPGSEAHVLKPLFSFPSHLSPIKSLALSSPLAASGAASDDAVKIYDLSSLSVIGSLTDHNGAVTSLSFFTPPSLSFPRNLLTASDDGTVCIYDVDPFVCLKTVVAHKKGVNDLAVHPSGKLGLTVGRDACLAMLNLVRGKRSFCCRLGREASIVRFDDGGERFYMGTEENVSVHDSEDARLLLELENQKRVLCVVPGENGLLFTGGEDRNITAWDTRTGKVAYCIEDAHSTRVKGLVVLGSRSSSDEDAELPYLVASASSDGVIRVWDVRVAKKEKPNPLTEAKTKSRLTCLAGSSVKSFKRPVAGGKEEAVIAQEDS
ncbi:uncharacterized protein LOC131243169 [Magnolia sinica]|uniref:uncharacterized protein LOC131243169 n=1 Tax=Magnolia sinica TaxID=86752 RepID=UPI00265AE6CE|nr:uncharacterized protein LOC131243169 [Magnolia sinica]